MVKNEEKHFKVHLSDLDLLDELMSKPVKSIAREREVEEAAVYKKIIGIRDRVEEYQWYLNSIYAKQKRSKRVKKLTIKGSLETEEDDEEWLE